MAEGIFLVPFNIRPIQAITHSKGGDSIRQTERRYVPPLLVLHLWCVYHFTFFFKKCTSSISNEQHALSLPSYNCEKKLEPTIGETLGSARASKKQLGNLHALTRSPAKCLTTLWTGHWTFLKSLKYCFVRKYMTTAFKLSFEVTGFPKELSSKCIPVKRWWCNIKFGGNTTQRCTASKRSVITVA